MSDAREDRTPWFLWPFVAVWTLLTLVLEVTSRIICAVIGLALMAIGVTISLSVVGAPLGVPIAALGMLLLVRSLF
jgi:hypothetical protein